MEQKKYLLVEKLKKYVYHERVRSTHGLTTTNRDIFIAHS